ncbi:alpha/beta hydrolase [Parendozoicomonas sp. Alg238-R29]|uniref:alpha/beta fold hydrolase n=1 Tax=Parendozoicomonas sp. Alg238-R29 TaxID=2993446 RepID=UPI00248F44CF|nr:alpha/beta hydrolase [Parendozoicomonas sp. Alg238-R29]
MTINSRIRALLVTFALLFITGCATQIPVNELTDRYAQPPSQFLQVAGMDIHVRDQGAADKPAIVMFHGIFSSLHTWEKWRPLLEKDYRLISLDLPNFGLTGPMPDKATSDEDYMTALDQVMEKLNVSEFYLVGNSLGGYFAYQYASRNPEKVKKLVMLDPAGYLFVPPAAMLMWGTPLVGRAGDYIEPPRFLFRDLLHRAYGNPEISTEEELERYATLLNREGNRKAGGRMIRRIRNDLGFDLSRLDQLSMPVLIMWGEDDGWIPVRHAYKFNEAIEGSELIIYPGVGHMPMEEIPEQSAQDLVTFLEK